MNSNRISFPLIEIILPLKSRDKLSSELGFRVGFSSWIFELGFLVGFSSWIFELDFRVRIAGFSNWIFELDFKLDFQATRISSWISSWISELGF